MVSLVCGYFLSQMARKSTLYLRDEVSEVCVVWLEAFVGDLVGSLLLLLLLLLFSNGPRGHDVGVGRG